VRASIGTISSKQTRYFRTVEAGHDAYLADAEGSLSLLNFVLRLVHKRFAEDLLNLT
jgi:hypothetical protein